MTMTPPKHVLFWWATALICGRRNPNLAVTTYNKELDIKYSSLSLLSLLLEKDAARMDMVSATGMIDRDTVGSKLSNSRQKIIQCFGKYKESDPYIF